MTNQRNKNQRKKTWVEHDIQGGLALRCAMYWFFCLCNILLFVGLASMFSGNLQPVSEIFYGLWRQFSAAILASVLLIPLVVWDLTKFSHRVVGPIVRLEGQLRRLADGKEVGTLKFRSNDYWHSVAVQFNRVSEMVQAGVPDKSVGLQQSPNSCSNVE